MITSKNLKMQLPEANDYVKVKEHITDNLLLVDDEISKKASKTVLGRIIVGDNLTVDANGRLSGNPDVDISGKMDKYKDANSTVNDYDDLIEDGFYIVGGSIYGAINAPHGDPVLVQVWGLDGNVYQKAVSYYDVHAQFTRCFKIGTKNTKWERIVNTANYSSMCPYSIGDILLTASNQNPAVKWVGTTWEKIEGRFLLSTSGSNASGQTGGSNTKTISKANLPNIKLQVDSFSLTTTKHIHGLRGNAGGDLGILFGQTKVIAGIKYGGDGSFSTSTDVMAEGGGENTGTASPYTSALGSGTPLDITPAYYTVHVWKRLT